MKRNLVCVGLVVVLCAGAAACGRATPEAVSEVDCTQTETHPIAQGIAEKYGVPYKQVMQWVCGGETFDDILLALQTSKLTGRPAEELLAMRKSEAGWEPVWEKLGLY